MMNKNEWKKVKLEDIGEIITGITPSTSNNEFYNKKEIPFYKPNDLVDDKIKFLNEATVYISNLARTKAKIIKEKSVLVTCIGIIGKVAIINREGAFNQQINCITPNESICDINYLAFAIKSKQKYMQYVANSAIVPIINKTQFSNIEILLPNIETQKIISKKLNIIQKIIEMKQQQLFEFEKLVKFQFLEMFGDPILNEKNWKTEKLENIYKIIDGDRGKNYPKQNEFYKDEFCLFLNAKNVTNFGFNFDKVEFITKEKDEMLRSGKLERGDIVVTTRGTIGNTAYYDNNIIFENIRINSGMVILREKEKINPIFFIKYFQNFKIYNKVVSGTAQPQIPITNMKNLKIIAPPIELQNKFADFVKQVDKSKFVKLFYKQFQKIKKLPKKFTAVFNEI